MINTGSEIGVAAREPKATMLMNNIQRMFQIVEKLEDLQNQIRHGSRIESMTQKTPTPEPSIQTCLDQGSAMLGETYERLNEIINQIESELLYTTWQLYLYNYLNC